MGQHLILNPVHVSNAGLDGFLVCGNRITTFNQNRHGILRAIVEQAILGQPFMRPINGLQDLILTLVPPTPVHKWLERCPVCRDSFHPLHQ